MVVKELLRSLEERLVQHDNNRKDIQSQLEEVYSRFIEEADLLEENINGEIEKTFSENEEQVFNLIEKLNNHEEENGDLKSLTQQARDELSHWQQYKIIINEETNNFVNQYKLEITKVKNEGSCFESENDIGNIVDKLKENLDKIHYSVNSVQDQLAQIATKRRNKGNEIKERINEELEQVFSKEDARIQEAVNMIKMNNEVTEEMISKVKSALLINQRYSLIINGNDYKLTVNREVSLKNNDFEERKPSDIIPTFTSKGKFSLSFSFFSDDEIEVLKTATNSTFKATIKLWENDKSKEENTKTITKELNLENKQIICFYESFNPNTTYYLKKRIEYQELLSKWSDEIEFTTPEFKDLCVWKECPNDVDSNKKYSVDENNYRIATFVCGDDIEEEYNCYSTIIGNTHIPLNKVTSWNIKILNSKKNDGGGIYVGVAPFDINQDKDNYMNCGWYFNCYDSALCSGPPHNYKRKEYGPRKEYGEYVHIGDSVGVFIDTISGNLSFVLNGVYYGVAYEGISLDKPLVPCVILRNIGDSVKLDLISEVKDNVDSSIPVPSNITTRRTTWDTITLTWNAAAAAEGAEFYQVEVDGSKFWSVAMTNRFTKRGLLEESEHTFRIRTVKGNTVSEWSDAVKGKTQKASGFRNVFGKSVLMMLMRK